jgi:hypothetical protein
MWLLASRNVSALLVLTALGVVGGAIAAHRSQAELSRSHMDGYSYEGAHDTCVDPDKWKDPITVAFVLGATPTEVKQHAMSHGYEVDEYDDEQRYYDHGLCRFEQVDVATRAEIQPPVSRFHLRARMGSQWPGQPDRDSTWGTFSVGTPHYDQAAGPDDWQCFLPPWDPEGHYVPENYEGMGHSGFDEGRYDIYRQWVQSGEHLLRAVHDWYNTAQIEQCNGERPQSNGLVYYIDMASNDGDGDGCPDSEEPSRGLDPRAWHDFYDVPVPANPDPTPNGPRNSAVNIADVLAILFYVPTSDGGPPSAGGVDYDSDKNGDTIKDGVDYDRSLSPHPSPPWDAGPPNGAINMADVLANLAQVPLACTGPGGAGASGESGPTAAPMSSPASSGPNAMALDAVSGGDVDWWRWVTGGDPFDIDVVITAAGEPYAGYSLALAYEDELLELVPESWAYTGLGGMSLDATVAMSDMDGDTLPDRAAGGSARSRGTTSETGAVVTARFRCTGNGGSTLHLVTPSESVLGTTTLGVGGAAIDTTLADATVWCWGVE